MRHPEARLPNRNYIVSISERGSERALTVQGQRAIVNGIKRMGDSIDPEMQRLASAIDLRKIPRAQLKEINLRIAEEAHQRVVSGYESRLPRRSLPYRPKDRLTGKLGEALRDPRMTSATSDKVISPLNVRILNIEAIHWWRVNYGALGPNLSLGHEEGEYPLRLPGGGSAGVLRDPSRPAPASWLPRWFGWQQTSVGHDFFLPLAGPADIEGAGIRAARFTDLALESIAETAGPYTFQGYRKFLVSQADKVRRSTVTIRASGDAR
jgi:hypothetical protein